VCCDSHRSASPFGNPNGIPIFNEEGLPVDIDRTVLLEAPEAESEDERCKCNGIDRNFLRQQGIPEGEVSYALANAREGCRCLRKLDGEDLRCRVCRAWCTPDMTPRVYSQAALAAMARAKGPVNA
jgi:hypothetical protein